MLHWQTSQAGLASDLASALALAAGTLYCRQRLPVCAWPPSLVLTLRQPGHCLIARWHLPTSGNSSARACPSLPFPFSSSQSHFLNLLFPSFNLFLSTSPTQHNLLVCSCRQHYNWEASSQPFPAPTGRASRIAPTTIIPQGVEYRVHSSWPFSLF